MFMRYRLFAIALCILSATTADAEEVVQSLQKGILDLRIWDTCQADRSRMWFEPAQDSKNAILVTEVSSETSNIDQCESKDRTADRELATNLASAFAEELRTQNSQRCAEITRVLGEPVIQRNELRLRERFRHTLREEYWYSLRFKIDAADGIEVPDCGSARWVLSQWKLDGRDGESPLLAQRFDNGVLHITVEDGTCRCMVAKADGDPFTRRSPPVARPFTAERPNLVSAQPLVCRGPAPDGQGVTACQPRRLRLRAAAPNIPLLPDPRIDWIRMTFFVRAGGRSGTRIDVYANGAFIVRIEGPLTQELPFGSRIKFKFGHYRDKAETRVKLLTEDFCMSSSVSRCDPGLQPVD